MGNYFADPLVQDKNGDWHVNDGGDFDWDDLTNADDIVIEDDTTPFAWRYLANDKKVMDALNNEIERLKNEKNNS